MNIIAVIQLFFLIYFFVLDGKHEHDAVSNNVLKGVALRSLKDLVKSRTSTSIDTLAASQHLPDRRSVVMVPG